MSNAIICMMIMIIITLLLLVTFIRNGHRCAAEDTNVPSPLWIPAASEPDADTLLQSTQHAEEAMQSISDTSIFSGAFCPLPAAALFMPRKGLLRTALQIHF